MVQWVMLTKNKDKQEPNLQNIDNDNVLQL
jgi:hypothetical protein